MATRKIGVLIRTLIECTTHIEYVLSARNAAGTLESEAEKYVQAYFADFARNGVADFKRAQVRQNSVHKRLGESLKSTAEDSYRGNPDVKLEQLYSNVYLTFSNYVHSKYPEVMDLYGGEPEHFHLHGMRGTPKDSENLETIEAFVTTVSLSLRFVCIHLKLRHLIDADPVLTDWFARST